MGGFFGDEPMFKNTVSPERINEMINLQFDSFNKSNESFIIFRTNSLMEKAFIHYNTHMPSSGASERLFSIAGFILAPKRNAINDKLFNQTILLKENKNHV